MTAEEKLKQCPLVYPPYYSGCGGCIYLRFGECKYHAMKQVSKENMSGKHR